MSEGWLNPDGGDAMLAEREARAPDALEDPGGHGPGAIRLPAREIAAKAGAAEILFTRDLLDTTYVTGQRGLMVLALDGGAYSVGRYDDAAGEWRVLSRGWPRFGNALAFACSAVS